MTLPSPLAETETITVAKAGYVTGDDGPEVTSGPPLLGEHTEEVLLGIGYSTQEIAQFKIAGTV